MRELFTGDTWFEPITLKKKSPGDTVAQAVNLTTATEIKVAVVDLAGEVILPSVIVSNVETGSDWENGIIIPVFSSEDTAALNVTDPVDYWFEPQVEMDGKKRTYSRVEFRAIKGANT